MLSRKITITISMVAQPLVFRVCTAFFSVDAWYSPQKFSRYIRAICYACRPEVENVAVQVRALWSRACFGMC